MEDSKTNQDENPDPIIEALQLLRARYDEIDLSADVRELPWNPDPRKAYDNNRFARREALTTDELGTLQDRLLQMQTCFLPSLGQQLIDLMKSQGLDGQHECPQPDTLEVISQLGDTLEQISNFLNSIAVIAVNKFQKTEEYDHEYGGLKKYRCQYLIKKINRLMDKYIWGIFDDLGQFILSRPMDRQICPHDDPDATRYRKWSILATHRALDTIDDIIESTQKSDFTILQDNWQMLATSHDSILYKLVERFTFTDRWEQDGTNDVDDDQAGNYSSNSPEESQDRNDSPDIARPSIVSLNAHEDIRINANSAGDHHGTQSVTALSIGPSKESATESLLIKVIESAIPLAKLCRILLKKLLNTPISKPPFTIGTKMSSKEIQSIRQGIDSLLCDFWNLLNSLAEDHTHLAEEFRERAQSDFDDAIIVLCFYLVPLDPHLDLPLSGNLSKIWFRTIKEQFGAADHNLRIALESYQRHIERIEREAIQS
ncbi:hypothetical protein MJO28_001340 [Puccinia striiformis f. sp. tritici]|uniref:Uncharacterized protein n=1 Tax=Puccinia striiformis f. sp. tritici TaxID=168172 RepID=A0ACC0ETP0_9BASI|nr:hypothetical protein MJO28_001340 [Puccinia striiformis f. sp. tritici]